MLKTYKLLLFLLILGLSCQKDSSYKNQNDPQQDLAFVKKARSYFYKDLKSGAELSKQKVKRVYPYWDFAYTGKNSRNVEFVEVPVVSEKRSSRTINKLIPGVPYGARTKDAELPVLSSSLQRLVIYKTKDGKLEQRVVNYVPDREYLKKANHDISRNHIDKLDPEFSGYIHYSNKYGQELYILKIRDGKVVKKITPNRVKANIPREAVLSKQSSRGAQTNAEVCEYYEVTIWEQVCITFEPDGPNGPSEEICSDWEIVDQYIEESCYDDGTPEDPCEYEDCNGEPNPDPNPNPDPEPEGPGDKLCTTSFNFTSTAGSHLANVTGLKFENGGTVNQSSGALFSLTNGIRDVSMNQVPANDYFGQGKTCMQYLQDLFPALFTNGSITSTYENGEKIWNFSTAAAQAIAGKTANIAAIGVTAQFGSAAAIPGNQVAWESFYGQATSIVKSLMPGSVIKKGYSPNAGNSAANYSPFCN